MCCLVIECPQGYSGIALTRRFSWAILLCPQGECFAGWKIGIYWTIMLLPCMFWFGDQYLLSRSNIVICAPGCYLLRPQSRGLEMYLYWQKRNHLLLKRFLLSDVIVSIVTYHNIFQVQMCTYILLPYLLTVWLWYFCHISWCFIEACYHVFSLLFQQITK